MDASAGGDRRDATRRSPRFGWLLILIIGVYAAVIGLGSTRLGGAVRLGLMALVLLVAVRLRSGRGRGTGVATGAALVALLAGVLVALLGMGRPAAALTSCASAVLASASMVAIARYLWRRAAVDARTVSGALSVYLLLALLFAAVHQLLAALLTPPYLDGVRQLTDAAGYLYFSVITLATVGYGDVTPACDAARAVAMVEALVGQLYLVAVVGTVVGRVTARRR